MKKVLHKAKANLVETIKEKYGNNTHAMYKLEEDLTKGSVGSHHLFKSSTKFTKHYQGNPAPVDEESYAWNAWVRKIQIKLLQAQLGIIEEQGKPKKKYLAKWLWMTSGEKMAAGFGNLYHQTYTMVMKTSLKEVMDNLGIAFRTRNYAMRFSRAGPELALCSEQIFGSDYDSLSTDFYEDNPLQWRKAMFLHKAAMVNPQRPIFFSFGKSKSEPLAILEKMGHMGLPVLVCDMKVDGQMRNFIPDTKEDQYDHTLCA